MLKDSDIHDVDFDIDEDFEELNTHEKIKNAANVEYEVFDADPVNAIEKIDNPEIRKVLENSFNEIVKKNGLSVNFKDFNEIVTHLSDYTQEDSEFNRIYVSKMINAVTDIAKLKSTIALGFLTDKALELVMKVAQDPNVDSLNTIVASIREIYSWLDNLQNLRDKYFIAGSDKMMQSIADKQNPVEKDKLSPAALTDLVAQLNKTSLAEQEARKNKENPTLEDKRN